MRNSLVLFIIFFCGLTLSSLQSCQPTTSSDVGKTSGNPSSIEDTPTIKLPAAISPNKNDRRAIWQKPELVLKKLGQIKNKVIADIGAGSGYFAFRILPTCKKVIAIDIDAEALNYMDSIAILLPEEYKSHFETRLATTTDSNLNPNEADIILMVNTYLYIADRINYLKHLKSVLPPDGQLLIIDYKKKIIPTGPEVNERVSLSQTEQDLLTAGFRIMDSDDHSLDYQYIILARP